MTGLPLVLVHGGGHGAWCWAPTLEHLQHPALAVDLPPKQVRGGPERFARPPELRTLGVADFATSVLADADAAGLERFVLVGHSLAGLTLPEVARRAPGRVAHLVFVSCSIPPEGGTVLDTLDGVVADLARANLERGLADPSSAPSGPPLPEDAVRAMFCNDMDEAQTRVVLDHFGNEVLPVVAEPVSRREVPASIPKTWVRLLRDAALPVARQDANIANLEASPGGTVEVVDLDAAHDAMISRPRELAAILDLVASRAS